MLKKLVSDCFLVNSYYLCFLQCSKNILLKTLLHRICKNRKIFYKIKRLDSRILLRDVVDKIHSLGYKVVNVDTTIMAQAPRMAAYESEMIKNVASDLKVDVSCVSIKATTTEKLGFTGRKEGIAVESVALLQKTE